MEKKKNVLNWIYRLLLLGFPMLHLNIGVDVADIGYNLAVSRTAVMEICPFTVFLFRFGEFSECFPFGILFFGSHMEELLQQRIAKK